VKDDGGRVVAVDGDIQAAIIIEIAYGQAARRERDAEGLAAGGGHVLEVAATVDEQRGRFQIFDPGLREGDVIHDVALRDD